MTKTDPILWSEHAEFSHALAHRHDAGFFRVDNPAGGRIGVVYLTDIDHTGHAAEVGLYRAPGLRTHGIGTALLNAAAVK